MNIFEVIHKPITDNSIYPLVNCYNDCEMLEVLKEKFDIPNEDYVRELCENHNIEFYDMYFVNYSLTPYMYMPEGCPYIVPIHMLTEEFFSMFHIDEKIIHYQTLYEDREFIKLFYSMDDKHVPYVYKKIKHDLDDDEFFDVFKYVHSEQEYDFDIDTQDIEKLKNSDKEREYIREMVKDLIDDTNCIDIYRGQSSKSKHYTETLSWTTSLHHAKFFANRFKGKGTIYSGKVNISDIIAFIDREDEVLVNSTKIKNIVKIK